MSEPEKKEKERVTAYLEPKLYDDLDQLIFGLRRQGLRPSKTDIVAAALTEAVQDFAANGKDSAIFKRLQEV